MIQRLEDDFQSGVLNELRAHLLIFPNRVAIESLLRFLSHFVDNSSSNSMNATNLAIVWTPSLSRENNSQSLSVSSSLMGSGSSSLGSKYPSLNPRGASSSSLLESVSSFMKDARSVIEFLILHVNCLFSIPRTDLSPIPPSPRFLRPPTIGCRRMKLMHATPYEIFLRIILERSSWDPLVMEILDEGGSVQRVKHSFSHFLPHTKSHWLKLKRKWPQVSPLDKSIQIHEESLSDDSQTSCSSMPSYLCDWFISATGSNKTEVNLAIFFDLKGHPVSFSGHFYYSTLADSSYCLITVRLVPKNFSSFTRVVFNTNQ